MPLTNREIKYLKSLRLKKIRQEEKVFIVEGIRLLEESLRENYLPRQVFFVPADMNDRGHQLINGFIKKRVKIQEISTSVSKRISGAKSSPGVIGLFPFREQNLEQQLSVRPRKILICDRINDPGNLGTLMRSAAAFDFNLIVTTPNSAELTNPKTVRGGMGAYFKIPTIESIPPDNIKAKLQAAGYHIYCGDILGDKIDQNRILSSPIALVIGSEVSGIDSTFKDESCHSISIPMAESTESLNAAVAGSILMYLFNFTGVPKDETN